MEPTSPPTNPALDLVVQRRAEMQRALRDVGTVLAEEGPTAAPDAAVAELWASRLRVALTSLSADFQAHVLVTEGPGGLHAEVSRVAPRLIHAVRVLTQDHAHIAGHLTQLLDDLAVVTPARVEGERTRAASLVDEIQAHRQRGADLVFEAFQADLGGED